MRYHRACLRTSTLPRTVRNRPQKSFLLGAFAVKLRVTSHVHCMEVVSTEELKHQEHGVRSVCVLRDTERPGGLVTPGRIVEISYCGQNLLALRASQFIVYFIERGPEVPKTVGALSPQTEFEYSFRQKEIVETRSARRFLKPAFYFSYREISFWTSLFVVNRTPISLRRPAVHVFRRPSSFWSRRTGIGCPSSFLYILFAKRPAEESFGFQPRSASQANTTLWAARYVSRFGEVVLHQLYKTIPAHPPISSKRG